LQGSGFVIFRDEICGKTLIEGGSGFDSVSPDMPMLLPERYEAGTLATPSIVSLSAGIKYIRAAGVEMISKHLGKLTRSSSARISEMRGVKIYGAENGMICFTIDGIHPSEVAASLDGLGICVRAGLHCSPSAHRVMGTLDHGAVRASFSFMNSERDAIGLADGIYKIIKSK
jgi:selenocysteine lyase/cysteine desulfurase